MRLSDSASGLPILKSTPLFVDTAVNRGSCSTAASPIAHKGELDKKRSELFVARALKLPSKRCRSIRFAHIHERVSTECFVVLSIGNSRADSLSAQGTVRKVSCAPKQFGFELPILETTPLFVDIPVNRSSCSATASPIAQKGELEKKKSELRVERALQLPSKRCRLIRFAHSHERVSTRFQGQG